MKKQFLKHMATVGTALILSAFTAVPAFAASLAGHLDTVSSNMITGWAWNAEAPNECISVELTISSGEGPGATTIVTVPALLMREDLQTALGSGIHGFVYEIDWTKLNGEVFTVTAAAVSGTEKTPLIGSFLFNKEEMLLQAPITTAAPQQTPAPDMTQTQESPATETPVSELPADKIALGPGYAGNSEAAMSPSTTKTSSTKTTASGSKSKADTTDSASAEETAAVTAKPGEYLGEFKASGYCNCTKCSGGYTKTYSGTIPKANHTISADLSVFPIGTKLVIDGITYTVEDKGSGVNGNRIDIYFATHAEALAFGLQTIDVYAPEE